MRNYKRPILLVEDNPMDVDLTRRAFASRKVTNPVEVARDGEEALAFIHRWEVGELLPILVLLDLKLPKVDGLEVLHNIKTHPRFHIMPVIVLTTSSEDHDIHMAYQEGANSYIIKPVDFDRFLQVVEQIHTYWLSINVSPT